MSFDSEILYNIIYRCIYGRFFIKTLYAFEVQSSSVKLQYQLIYLRNIIYPIERAINIKTDKRKAMFLPIWRCIKENKLFKGTGEKKYKRL